MDKTLVVLLSRHTLFTEGVASRLKQYPKQVEVKIIDPEQPDALDEIVALEPSAVILDAADNEIADRCFSSTLLVSLPEVKLIRLHTEKEQVQIVTSTQYAAGKVSDLIQLIEPGIQA